MRSNATLKAKPTQKRRPGHVEVEDKPKATPLRGRRWRRRLEGKPENVPKTLAGWSAPTEGPATAPPEKSSTSKRPPAARRQGRPYSRTIVDAAIVHELMRRNPGVSFKNAFLATTGSASEQYFEAVARAYRKLNVPGATRSVELDASFEKVITEAAARLRKP